MPTKSATRSKPAFAKSLPAGYRLYSDSPRRYEVIATGEILTRAEMNKRVNGGGSGSGSVPTAPRRMAPLPPLPKPKSAPAPLPDWITSKGTGGPADDLLGSSTVEAPDYPLPPPPSFGSGLGEDLADAADDMFPGSRDRSGLWARIADMAAAGICAMGMVAVPQARAWMVPEAEDLADVLRPIGRIADRHMPITAKLDEDAEDILAAVGAAAVLVAHLQGARKEAMKYEQERYADAADDYVRSERSRRAGAGTDAGARPGAGERGAGPPETPIVDAMPPWQAYSRQFGAEGGSGDASQPAQRGGGIGRRQSPHAGGGNSRNGAGHAGMGTPARGIPGGADIAANAASIRQLFDADAFGRLQRGLG